PTDRGTTRYDFTRDDDLRRYLTRLGDRAGAVLSDPDLWDLLVPPLRGDLLMSQHYRYTPGPPLTCPLTLVAAAADHGCTIDDKRPGTKHTIGPPTSTWCPVTTTRDAPPRDCSTSWPVRHRPEPHPHEGLGTDGLTKHLISIDDLDDDDSHHVVDRAARFAGPVEQFAAG
ncbi:hypothetical protein K7G98_17625, partial [Saccharothrix sp. MB29]|nr:hypothetical protein [Saccharothrix sp. MB29]